MGRLGKKAKTAEPAWVHDAQLSAEPWQARARPRLGREGAGRGDPGVLPIHQWHPCRWLLPCLYRSLKDLQWTAAPDLWMRGSAEGRERGHSGTSRLSSEQLRLGALSL